MSKTGRKQKYTIKDLRDELSLLVRKRDFLRMIREVEQVEQRFNGEENEVPRQSEQELEIIEKIAALRSVMYKRKD